MQHAVDALHVIGHRKGLPHYRQLLDVALQTFEPAHGFRPLHEFRFVGLHHQIAKRSAAQGLVHRRIGHADFTRLLEPCHQIVVDVYLRGAGNRDGHEDKPDQHGGQRTRHAHFGNAAQETGGTIQFHAFALGGLGDLLFLDKGEDGRNQAEGEQPQHHRTEGDQPAEHHHRHDVHEQQHGEAGRGGECRVAHRTAHRRHGLADRHKLIPALPVAEIELVEDVDAVGGDSHQEYRRHRAHDMHRITGADQRPHAYDNCRHGHAHHGAGERKVAEHHLDRGEHNHAGDGREDCHQLEHFGAEGIARHRVAGDVVALRPVLIGHDLADIGGDYGAIGALLQRHIDGRGLAVLRDHAVNQQRVAEQRGTQRFHFRICLRRARHQRADFQCTGIRRDIGDGGETVHIAARHAFQLDDCVGDAGDASQGIPVEHPRIVLHADDNGVLVQRKRLVHLVVPDTHVGVFRQHVLRVGVRLDAWELGEKQQRKCHRCRHD